ncbi:acetate and butyrate kinase [Punctularia strigosozonata HHB-11173 SS5]|uniref:acetate and butyrate kinase n=1 Tax=Punctularia strigosozonata (strain HHB-11173) TaxID=741275 RepID=UPI0004416B3C|nr:acetate and butyrate kinase [Punctularia strigosozonata HHB-11173 SS5]EIN09788.1 acetate and butyrate kinase [Punctularia strigosozonata HHB-11173 SS5]
MLAGDDTGLTSTRSSLALRLEIDRNTPRTENIKPCRPHFTAILSVITPLGTNHNHNHAQRQGLILSVNAGSSSLKISLFKPSGSSSSDKDPVADLLLESSIDDLSSPPARFTLKHEDASPSDSSQDVKKEQKDDIKDHASAFSYFLGHLEHESGIKKADIKQVCHRVVHGGDYAEPVTISSETYHHIEKLTDLAPLHNGAALAVIQACLKSLPNARSIAYFDTTFHRALPAHTPTSSAPSPPTSVSIIALHLGSGASACAIHVGRSIDTSMGLTPVHGLPGATRAGAIDPSLIFHYANTAGRISHDPAHATNVGVTEAEEILNKKSGLAFDLFVDRIVGYVGAYFVALQGNVDALVFAGGIGEKSVELRERVAERVRCLGFRPVDPKKNVGVGDAEGAVVDITAAEGGEGEGEGKRMLVCRTDEQYEMARECVLEDEFWK